MSDAVSILAIIMVAIGIYLFILAWRLWRMPDNEYERLVGKRRKWLFPWELD